MDKYEENLCLLDVEIRGVIVDDGINAGKCEVSASWRLISCYRRSLSRIRDSGTSRDLRIV